MKNLISNLILIASLASSSAVFAGPRGGVGDGGGNVQSENLTHPDLIREKIANSKLPTLLALQRLEFTLEGMPEVESAPALMAPIRAKLFLGKKTVYEALREARFLPKENGPCETVNGEDRDASALNAPDLCFSLELLAKKIHDYSGPAELIGLVAHEVSHMVGTTEEEAQLVQTLVQTSLSTTVYSVVTGTLKQFRDELRDFAGLMDTIQYYAKAGNQVAFCTAWSSLQSRMTALESKNFEAGDTLGISFFRAKDIWLYSAVTLKMLNMFSLCYGEVGDYAKDGKMTKLFSGRNAISLREYYVALSGTAYSKTTHFPAVAIRRVTKFKSAALTREIEDISGILRTIKDDVMAIQD